MVCHPDVPPCFLKKFSSTIQLVLYCIGLSPPCNAPSAGNLWQTLLKASIITACPSHLNYSLESHTSLPGPLKGLSVSHRTSPPLPRDRAACSTYLSISVVPRYLSTLRLWDDWAFSLTLQHILPKYLLCPLWKPHTKGSCVFWILEY